MPRPSEHKTVQARILDYAQEIGWTYVRRGEAEKRREFDHSKATPAEQAAEASPYFDDLLDAQLRKLNPKCAVGPDALVGDLRRLHADIAGSRCDNERPQVTLQSEGNEPVIPRLTPFAFLAGLLHRRFFDASFCSAGGPRTFSQNLVG